MKRGSKVEQMKRRFENPSSQVSEVRKSENGESQKIKRTPAFRANLPNGSPRPQKPLKPANLRPTNFNSPLPVGPAPRKPPRTFAHVLTPTAPTSQTAPPPLVRSKTEPLIMLKKIESALNLHNGQEEVKSWRKKPVEPVYSEPVRSPHNQNGTVAPRQSTSLYYMSTPVASVGFEPFNVPAGRKHSYEEALKKLQMWMIEPSLNRIESDSDAESAKEVKPEVVEERKTYAQRVSSMRQQQPSKRIKIRSGRLMEALLLVGIDTDLDNGKTAFIKSKYPANASVPENIACLIFPDANDWPPISPRKILPSSATHNSYTIVLTSADASASRSYAYCRRLQPEGCSVCLPLAYAIITPHRASSFYYKILMEIENNHGFPDAKYKEFLRSLYNMNFPPPAEVVHVGDTFLKRSQDPRIEENHISTLLQVLRIPQFLQLFSSLLLENKVILVSSSISLLSDAIEALQKSLLPFEWPHTIITVLPPSMYEILQSPMPYLVGLLETRNEKFNSSFFQNIDHVLVMNLDRSVTLCRTNDQGSVIPERVAKTLNVTLYLTPMHTNDVAPSEALIRLFVELVGHYSRFLISSHPQSSRSFQKDSFIRAAPSRSIRQFLEWFTDTSMFQVFITQRMMRKNDEIFDRRCAEYIEENMKRGKSLNKAVKHLGDRFKDWATSS